MTIRAPSSAEPRQQFPVADPRQAVDCVLATLAQDGASRPSASGTIDAVGHRVVHGGERFTTAVGVTPEVRRAIAELGELAPLHNPASLEVINAVAEALPGVPQIAVFDTAFHSTMTNAARTYPVPRQWTRQWAIRRYGFHGLSHAYCASRAAELLQRTDLRLIIAHLGNGASISAVRDGVCIDTSMGFTPMEGLMMGTRSGSVDPGLLIHLLRDRGMTVEQLDHALNVESGLLGVSGISSDMRKILADSLRNPDARLALEIYVHRLQQAIGAMAATLGGVDALVFTAGVGENAAEVRRLTCDQLAFLGIRLDHNVNASPQLDGDVATKDSPTRVLVIRTREDLTIVRAVRRLVTGLIVPPLATSTDPQACHSQKKPAADRAAMKEQT